MGMNNIGRIEPVHEMASEGLILLNIGHAVHYADWNYKNVNSPFEIGRASCRERV